MGLSLRTRQKAVTVAEMVMAFGILAIAILAIVSGFLGAIELNARSVDTAVASQVGREFLERVHELGYDIVPEGNFTFVGANNDPQTADGFPPPLTPRFKPTAKTTFCKYGSAPRGPL